MLAALDRIHALLFHHPLARRFTLVNRLLLAGGFIPTGLVKVLGMPFTLMPETTTVGRFFAVFYDNQLWYQSVGWAQVIAGLLLLFPRTAHLGGFLFLPILVNINLVTIGVGFKGTPVITGLMLLANLWLIAWDYPRWRNWFDKNVPYMKASEAFSKSEWIGVGIGSTGVFMMLFVMRGFSFPLLPKVAFVLIAAGFLWWVAAAFKEWKAFRVRRKGE